MPHCVGRNMNMTVATLSLTLRRLSALRPGFRTNMNTPSRHNWATLLFMVQGMFLCAVGTISAGPAPITQEGPCHGKGQAGAIMTCENISCSSPCEPSYVDLTETTRLFYCPCGVDTEPLCCHTQQRRVNGVFLAPEGNGPCKSTNAQCPAGSCTGTAATGFWCH